jgi:hypothetical protein
MLLVRDDAALDRIAGKALAGFIADVVEPATTPMLPDGSGLGTSSLRNRHGIVSISFGARKYLI